MNSLRVEEGFDVLEDAGSGLMVSAKVSNFVHSCLSDQKQRSTTALSQQQLVRLMGRVQLLQTLRLIGTDATVLFPPAVIRLIGHADLTTILGFDHVQLALQSFAGHRNPIFSKGDPIPELKRTS